MTPQFRAAASSPSGVENVPQTYNNRASAPEIVAALRDMAQSRDTISLHPDETLGIQLGRNLLQRLNAEATANLLEEHPKLIAPDVHGGSRAIDLRFLGEPVAKATAAVAHSHVRTFLDNDLHELPSLDPKYAHATLIALNHTLHVAEARHTKLPDFAAPEAEQSALYQAHRLIRGQEHRSVKERVKLAARKYPETWSDNEQRDLGLLLSLEITPELRAAALSWHASLSERENPHGCIADALEAETLANDPDVFALSEFVLAKKGHGDPRKHLLAAYALCIDPELHYRIARALAADSDSLHFLQEARRLAPDADQAVQCENELADRDPGRTLEYLENSYKLQGTKMALWELEMARAHAATQPHIAIEHLRKATQSAPGDTQFAKTTLMLAMRSHTDTVELLQSVCRMTQSNEDRATAEYMLARYRHGDQSQHLTIAQEHAVSPRLQALIEIEFARLESNRQKAAVHLEKAHAFAQGHGLEVELTLAAGRLAGAEGRAQLASVAQTTDDHSLQAEASLSLAELQEYDAVQHATDAIATARIPEVRAAAAYILADQIPEEAADWLKYAEEIAESNALLYKIRYARANASIDKSEAIQYFRKARECTTDPQSIADCSHQIALRNKATDTFHWREVWRNSINPTQQFEAALTLGTAASVALADRQQFLRHAILLAPDDEQRAQLYFTLGATFRNDANKARVCFKAARDIAINRETQAYAEIALSGVSTSDRVVHLQNAKKLNLDPVLKSRIQATLAHLTLDIPALQAEMKRKSAIRNQQAEHDLRIGQASTDYPLEWLKRALRSAQDPELQAKIHHALSDVIVDKAQQCRHLEAALALTRDLAFRRSLELALAARSGRDQSNIHLERALASSAHARDLAPIHLELARHNYGDVIHHLLQAAKSSRSSDDTGEAELRLALAGHKPVLDHLRTALRCFEEPEETAIIEALIGLELAKQAEHTSSAIEHFRRACTLTNDKQLLTSLELHLATLDESSDLEHLAAAKRLAPDLRSQSHVALGYARQAQRMRTYAESSSISRLDAISVEHLLNAERLACDEQTRTYAKQLRKRVTSGSLIMQLTSALPAIARKVLYTLTNNQPIPDLKCDVPN